MQLRLIESYYPPSGSTHYWIEYKAGWWWRYLDYSSTSKIETARAMFDRVKANGVQSINRTVATHP